jgi:hypothetical protein
MAAALGGGPARFRAGIAPVPARRRDMWPGSRPGPSASADMTNADVLQLKVELVTVDGAEGQALEERQLTVIREILQWLNRHKPIGSTQP